MTKITYDDLRLGEKAKEAYLSGKSLDWIKDNCPVYLNTNTQGGIAGLNTTDLVVAGVLAGMPVLVGGQYGSGKSQLGSDMYRYFFGGSKLSGGEGVRIDVNPSTEIMEPVNGIYTRYTTETKGGVAMPKVELSGNVLALMHFIDEINRTPTIKQNQFYSPLNGHITHEARDFEIGHDGYRVVLATANIGNGLYQGTFDFDPALRNRFGLVIDTNYAMFEPTEDDRGLISLLREADPAIKSAPLRDISKKVLEANREVKETSTRLSLSERAVLWYLQEGLRTCVEKDSRSKEGEFWFEKCRTCSQKTDTVTPACYFMGAPVTRTLEATKLYASALAFLAKLKNPTVQISGTDLMFKAFELTVAYQPFINPDALQSYRGGFSRFMADSMSKLKSDFGDNKDYILTSLDLAEQGKTANFYRASRNIGNIGAGEIKVFPTTSEAEKEEVDKGVRITRKDKAGNETTEQLFEEVRPFDEKRVIGLGWVNGRADLIRRISQRKENIK